LIVSRLWCFHKNLARRKVVRIEERDILGSCALEEWPKRSTFTQNFYEFPYFDSREQRRPWTDGNYDPFVHEEKQNQRCPPEFNMQRV
jgi:hypothetical protein